MTATMYPNIPNSYSYPYNANIECTSPEMFNAMLNNNNYVPYPQSNAEMDNYSQYSVALSSGPDQNMIDYCHPALASSPSLPNCAMTHQSLENSSEELIYKQIVKDTLKEKIQRRNQSCGRPSLSLMDPVLPAKEEASWQTTSCCVNSFPMSDDSSYSGSALTPEDEERRRKRRERNKIAATKCRNKKKEKTQILVRVSEELEHENVSYKREIKMLTEQLQCLRRTLDSHVCVITPPPPPLNNSDNFYNGNNNYVLQDFNIDGYPSCSQL